MSIDSYIFNIKNIYSFSNENKEYVIELYNEESFKINEQLYNIIRLFKDSNNNIKESMKTEIHNNEYYYRCIEYMIKNNILIEKNNILKNKKAKIRFNKLSLEIDLISTEKLDKLLNILKILINKYIFILSIFSSLIMLKLLTMTSFKVKFSSFENFCIVLLVILSMIIHELGHLSGCKKFNVNTGFLGVGLYIIIPRIYVGIKNIWTIDNKKRSIIDGSGVYFQLIYINILFFIYYFTNQKLLIPVINITLMIIIFNMIPLFNLDGYWFLLDYFNINNFNINNFILKDFFKQKKSIIFINMIIILSNMIFFTIILINTINYFENFPTVIKNLLDKSNIKSGIYYLIYIINIALNIFFRLSFILFLIKNIKKIVYNVLKERGVYGK